MKRIFSFVIVVVIATGSFAQSSITNGNYYIQSPLYNLGFTGSTHGGQVITTYASDAALYSIINTGDGDNSFYIKNLATGYNLDANGGATGNGTKIINWDNNGGRNQKWQFFSNGTNYEIRGLASGRDMAISGATVAVNVGIVLWDKNTGWNQLFKLTPGAAIISNGFYTINAATAAAALNIAPVSPVQRAVLKLLSGSSSPVFYIANSGDGKNSYTIKHVATGLYVEAYQNNNNTALDLFDGSTGDNALWQFFQNSNAGNYEVRGKASGRDWSLWGGVAAGNPLILFDPSTANNFLFTLKPYTFSFSTQPTNKNITAGEATGFYAPAGSSVTSYQWQYSSNGVNWINAPQLYSDVNGSWSGGNSDRIQIVTTKTTWNALNWRLKVVALDNNTYYSQLATLTVTAPLVTCTSLPVTTNILYGNSASFTVGYTVVSTGETVPGNAVYWLYSLDGGYSWVNAYDFSTNGSVSITGGVLSGVNSNTLTVTPSNPNFWGSTGLRVRSVARVPFYNCYSNIAYIVAGPFTINKESIKTINQAGLNADQVKAVVVYPNPAHSSITVANLIGTSTISVCDGLGNTLSVTKTANTSEHLNINNYASGTYTLKVLSSVDGHVSSSSIKFIKD